MKVLFVFVLGLLSIKSCNVNFGNGEKGNRKIVSKEISIEDYSVIETFGSADVIYEQKDVAPYLRLVIDENLIEYVSATVESGVLTIRSTEQMKPTEYKIYTNSPNLSKVKIEGSTDVELRGTLNSDNLEISLAGSGEVEADNLQVKELIVEIQGASDVELSGKATDCNIRVKGSGDVKAYNLEAKNVICRISGSGDVNIHAVETLNVEINGSGDVKYKGKPQITQSVRGSGTVKSK